MSMPHFVLVISLVEILLQSCVCKLAQTISFTAMLLQVHDANDSATFKILSFTLLYY